MNPATHPPARRPPCLELRRLGYTQPLRSITSGTPVTIAETGGHDAPKRSVTINRNDRSRSPKYAPGVVDDQLIGRIA